MRHLFFLIALTLCTVVWSSALAPSANAQGPTHLVAYGESLYSIARKYGVSAQALADANGITINSWVYAGQRLVIPGAGNSTKPSSTAAQVVQISPSGVYTVRAGDTLYGVARSFGASVEAIADANDIPPNGVLYVGWQLKIPGATSAMNAPAKQPSGSTSSTSANNTQSTAYIVQAGDTLYRIALNHGVSIQAISIANNLPTQFVYTGQRLIIPGSTSTTSAPTNGSTDNPPVAKAGAPDSRQSNTTQSNTTLSNTTLSVRVTGIPAYRQKQTLTCEESAAAMALRGELSEAQIVAAMPHSENPFEGIRGDTDHPLLGGLTHYGTYAQGLQKGLAALGKSSTVLYGLPYAKFKQTILDSLRAGQPVLWWTTWRESYQVPQWQKLTSGITIHLVPYEHTVVIVGANDQGITYHDPYDATVRFTTWANHQRTSGYFGNMALIIK